MSNGLEDLYLNPHSVLELEQSKSLTGSTAAETPTNQTNQPEPTNQTIKLARSLSEEGEKEKVKETYFKEERDKKQTQKSCGSDLTKETYSALIAHDYALRSAQRRRKKKKKSQAKREGQIASTNHLSHITRSPVPLF